MQTNLEGEQLQISGLDSWCGKMSSAHYQAPEKETQDGTSKPSSRKSSGSQSRTLPMFLYLKRGNGQKPELSWASESTDVRFPSLGEYTTVAFGESPKDAVDSRLSAILEVCPHPRYSLSALACQGILRRAERRGKELPEILKEALIRQATLSKSGGGCEVDSAGKRAGKGPLVQTELSGTLGVTQDQSLICLNDQGGVQMSVTEDVTGTLRAQEHGHQPLVAFGISAYDSNAMKSSNPMSGIYEAETARTLDLNGGSPACNQGGMAIVQGTDVYNRTLTDDGEPVVFTGKADGADGRGVAFALTGDHDNRPTDMTNVVVNIENRPSDARFRISDDGTVQTLTGRMGTGGGNTPMVMYPDLTGALMASGYDKLGTQEAMNGMFVVEGQSWDGSQIAPTLTANNAGGSQRMPDKDNFNAVLTPVIGTIASNGVYAVGEDEAQTLKARDFKEAQAIFGIDRAAFNQGENAKFDFAVEAEPHRLCWREVRTPSQR